ncbi:Golgi apparatus membrane protein tvp23 [Hypoxylon texense]
MRTVERFKQEERWKLLKAESKDEKLRNSDSLSQSCAKSQQRPEGQARRLQCKEGHHSLRVPRAVGSASSTACVAAAAFSKKRAAEKQHLLPKQRDEEN